MHTLMNISYFYIFLLLVLGAAVVYMVYKYFKNHK